MKLALVSLAAALVAACGGGGGGDDDSPDPSRTPTSVAATQTPTDVPTQAATQTPAATETAAATQTPLPTQTPVEGFSRNALLNSYTQLVALPALRDFSAEAAELESATAALAAAGGSGAALDAARAAWRSAIAAWQVVELLQVGPAGSPTMVMGGEGLRDEIYSWPTINPCRVDQETVSGDYANPDFFTVELVNTRGLDALEYLLFDGDTTNACDPAVDINAQGTWDALVAAGDLPARRAAYAAAAAAAVAERASELVDAWEPSGGNFAGELVDAGMAGSQFDSAQEAINDVFAGLFYIELRTKDRKLAAPAGISPDCTDAVCPQLRESLWADQSKNHLLVNMRTAERIFLGGDDSSGVGFDDFLADMNAQALATTMLDDLRGAIATTEAIPGTLAEALNSDPDAVRDAHADLKVFTDNLKSQFVTVLNLEIPREGAGDND